MKKPKFKTVWIIWAVVMAIYVAMNFFMLKDASSIRATALGWGIAMPILTNLVWWVIAFRLRFYFPDRWWVWGIATTVFVGLAGFLTMLAAASAAGAV